MALLPQHIFIYKQMKNICTKLLPGKRPSRSRRSTIFIRYSLPPKSVTIKALKTRTRTPQAKTFCPPLLPSSLKPTVLHLVVLHATHVSTVVLKPCLSCRNQSQKSATAGSRVRHPLWIPVRLVVPPKKKRKCFFI